jgi:anhydro-N-acetylmuramic acid kinase
MKKVLTILGVMSGTSLDGIDFALCRFNSEKKKYKYELINTGYVEYDINLKNELSNAHLLNTVDFIKFHKSFGTFIGKKAKEFLFDKIKPDYIASHGHTVFHNPSEHLTFQIGDGAFIAAETQIPVISDFRNLDTALHGQGAPLVPIGDKLLFDEYRYCLNLGGFANISYDSDGIRTAFDICPVNIVLNQLSKLMGFEYDKNGLLGTKGLINNTLLNELNSIPYYKLNNPKSLGREYIETYHLNILSQFNIPTENKLRTFYRHIAEQISNIIDHQFNSKILITGGGAHNSFLISEIKNVIPENEIIIPDNETINFKEAIIFAFLGYLRISNKINILKSVTGADINHIGGSVFII